MQATHKDDVVAGVLDRMDKYARATRLAISAAAVVEGLLMTVAILKVDWANSTQVLMFIFSVLGYMIVGLGLIALGAHVSRVGERIVAALDDRSRGRPRE